MFISKLTYKYEQNFYLITFYVKINYNGEDGEDICFDFDGENEVDDVIVAFPELIVEPAPEVAELV